MPLKGWLYIIEHVHIIIITSEVTRAKCAASIDIFNISCILYLIIIHKLKFFLSHATCSNYQKYFSAASAVVPPFAYIFRCQ